MMLGFINVPFSLQNRFGIISNYLDAPMMLIVLLFFCATQWKQKIIYYSLAAFVVYELIILFYYRLAPVSSTYILGPGILLILIYSIYLFFQQGKATVMYGKGLGLSLMLVSILFSYGCYSFIYFLHYIKKTPARADVFLIYYIVLIVSSVLLSLGIFWLQKRIKHINEVHVSRKELAHFFEI
jgi:NADH:ubiquinone oxidoreductase subunit K